MLMFGKTKKDVEALKKEVANVSGELADIKLGIAEGQSYILIAGVTVKDSKELDAKRTLLVDAISKLELPGEIQLLVIPNDIEVKAFQRLG
jgi:hypothetical protein